ncbi:hypothetical protein [Legionella waltersii]|uniref:Capsule polysaccharide biosynthesis protein n=1 Tax=Legionella waltersii TaxID=66969 RepID=A0A0W1AN48_9GAMM|nr:hypothetical protein [Legionella waltersii]KTD82759.1 hypothetical protein Lwal_0237 [Legionella waltersii]SNV01142.1 Uncharacterised protein [Legionella waltersii]
MDIFKKLSRYFNLSKPILRSLKIKDTWRKLQSCDLLLMAHENDRSYVFEGKLYSHIIDSIAWLIQKKHRSLTIQSLSLPFSYVKPQGAYNAPKSLNRGMLFAKISSKILRLLPFTKSYHLSFELRLWLKILNKCQPKAVIAVQPHPMLCKACRVKGIRVFDYQHGLINNEMPEYGFEGRNRTSEEFLPTDYLCWDNKSASIIKKWATQKGINTFVHGNPWLLRFMMPQGDDLLVSKELEHLKNLEEYSISSKDNLIILVTLQANPDIYFPDYFTKKQIIQSSLIQAINETKANITWLIRLHPIQQKDPITKNKIGNFFMNYSNVEIENASKVALPALFSKIHAHITWNSCVTVEAAINGIPSFVMDPRFTGNENDLMNIDTFFSNLENLSLVTFAKSLDCSKQIIRWTQELSLSVQQKSSLNAFNTNKFLKDVGLAVQEV